MFRISILALTILTVGNIMAQDGPKVVVFNSTSESKDEKSIDYFNIIKLSLIEPFNGDISLYYERILGQNISAEVGLGMTTTNYVSNFMIDEEVSSNSNEIPKIGTSFALSFRYYPFLAADEFYFSPEFKYRYYHNILQTDPVTGLSESYEESQKVSFFRINIGYVWPVDDKIYLDFFAGVGMAQKTFRNYSQTYDGTSGLWIYTPSNSSESGINVNVGVKFGFGF